MMFFEQRCAICIAVVFTLQLLQCRTSADSGQRAITKRRAPKFLSFSGVEGPTFLNVRRRNTTSLLRKRGRYLKDDSLMEGDIMGYTKESFAAFVKDRQRIHELIKSGRLANSAARDNSKHWPGGIVPYSISSNYARDARTKLAQAIKEYHKKTCIRFVPRTNQHDYIFIKSEGPYICASLIGRQGGMQRVLLGAKCFQTGTIVHELMHAVGFYHEQSRPDRDEFVEIRWQNIEPNTHQNFEKYPPHVIDILGTPYDYSSVMHYGGDYFSRNGRPTIIPKQGGVRIGQRRGFSQVDIQRLNILYKCDPNKPRPPGPGVVEPGPPQPPINPGPEPGPPVWPPPPQPGFCDYCQSCVGCHSCLGCENCVTGCGPLFPGPGPIFPFDSEGENQDSGKHTGRQ